MDPNEATRVRLGACETTSPDILRELASDPSVTVRASLAMNPALPQEVAQILASDIDIRVQKIIRRKLDALTPTLPTQARKRLQEDAVASLTTLVADAALRVRTCVAEAVRDLPDGPRDIILRLAHDPAVMVCEPVIRFSPMLTQEDLVALIASGPPPSTILAVASRPRISATVSDAIVSTENVAAITALLSNQTAQIREATLDALAAQSEEQTDWQEPLVRRPYLPPRAQRMLAEIVTGNLLETLASRADLDLKVSQQLRIALNQANLGRPSASPGHQAGSAVLEVDAKTALAQAQMLHQNGKLDDAAILATLRRNATVSAIAMLAVKAGVAVPVIERACGLRSAKALVSVAWKAGLTAQTAVALQLMLGRLAPDQVLRPRPDDSFSLSEEEMQWQLAFLGTEGQTRPWAPRRMS